jgi:hypothetical protein
MGEFVQFNSREDRTDPGIENSEIMTDVDGIKANGEYSIGIESFPIFNVDHEDFARSSQGLRNKVQWNTDSVRTYSQNSINGRPFYIRYAEQLKKIK